MALLYLGVVYFFYGLSCIVYAAVKVEVGFFLSAIMFGFTAWSTPPIMAASAGDFVGPTLAPAGLGFIPLFFGIGLGRILGGCQSVTIPFLVAGSISLIGIVFSFYLRKPVE